MSSFGAEAVSFFTKTNPSQIYIRETDKKLWLTFIGNFKFVIESVKLAVFDVNGEKTCKIATCNACNLTSEKIYNSPAPLESIFFFLNLLDDCKKFLNRRGIFDLFYHKGKFAIGFYVDTVLSRGEFSANDTFKQGCDPDYSPLHFYDLNEHRQTVFQTRVCSIENLNKPIDPTCKEKPRV